MVSIFKQLRDKKNWSRYEASIQLRIPQNVYDRLENGVNGERYLIYLFELLKLTGSNLTDLKKLVKEASKNKLSK